MEARDEKHTPFGIRRRHWGEFKQLLVPFRMFLKAGLLFEAGKRRALDLRIVDLGLSFPDLPLEFDGYRLLHLTDLHVDGLPQMADIIADRVRQHPVDLCVWTGDYRWRVHGPYEQVLPGLASIADAISTADGHYATLGNHDPVALVEPLERLGLRVLANETVTQRRGSASLHITGLDDVHYFYTEDAAAALAAAPAGFRIALVHSPEAAHLAASAGYSLYLCGHTHGGQICLPGGIPITLNCVLPRSMGNGRFNHHGMIGYTSAGAGVSIVPARFNCPPEITLHHLHRPK